MVLALVVGCSSDPGRSATGPLGTSATVSDGALCFPDDGDLTFVHSGEVLSNNSNSAVTLQSLELVEPVNVAAVTNLVAPTWTEGSSLMTFGSSPDETRPAGAESDRGQSAWQHRFDLAGARVDPGQSISVVVIARRESRQIGSFEALKINYESSGDDYSYRTQTRVVVQDAVCK